jgi:redox-sensitive bicupin YhaK (pirin superfamily)
MTERTTLQAQPIVRRKDQYRILDEDDFGVPGLVAHEIIGPFVDLHAVGPLIMVHDGVFEPYHGIGHHPHRRNERLFYILEGAVDHDDALNGITGHMGAGDMGRLTEGVRGMLHKEWNNTPGRARAFILVYETSPTPERAAFAALRDGDAPRYEEAPGAITKELAGPRVNFPLHGDIRFFGDTRMEAAALLNIGLAPGEGALFFAVEGEAGIEPGAARLLPDETAIFAPADVPRSVSVRALTPTRLLRATFGPGRGLVQGPPLYR